MASSPPSTQHRFNICDLLILGPPAAEDLMHDNGEFGRQLRQLRRARDLTQEALAQAAFCALDTVKKLESGRRRPSRQLAIQLADVLGLVATERPAFLAAARPSAAPADGALVAESLATIVGLPSSSQPTRSVLMQYLRDKRMLLLLDNCEHLIQACAELAEALLRACPDLHILATSREGLGVAGELVWPVPTLHVPDPEAQLTPAALATFEAVQLFIDRAALVSLGFALTAANAAAVRQICTRL